MNPNDARVPNSHFVYRQDAWFNGIDNAMKTLGSAQAVTPHDLIREQNAAIRKYWVAIGNHLRRAMLAMSNSKNVYPEELKGDRICRKMLKAKNVGA